MFYNETLPMKQFSKFISVFETLYKSRALATYLLRGYVHWTAEYKEKEYIKAKTTLMGSKAFWR